MQQRFIVGFISLIIFKHKSNFEESFTETSMLILSTSSEYIEDYIIIRLVSHILIKAIYIARVFAESLSFPPFSCHIHICGGRRERGPLKFSCSARRFSRTRRVGGKRKREKNRAVPRANKTGKLHEKQAVASRCTWSRFPAILQPLF